MNVQFNCPPITTLDTREMGITSTILSQILMRMTQLKGSKKGRWAAATFANENFFLKLKRLTIVQVGFRGS